MPRYQAPISSLWTGRQSDKPLYWYQNVAFVDIDSFSEDSDRQVFGLLGYQGDEGVIRNQGRAGAVGGPAAMRQMMAGMAWHQSTNKRVVDFGDVICEDGHLEKTHKLISKSVSSLISKGVFPIVLGGGHDLAYAHFKGIRGALGAKKRIGTLNLDAHFDLRKAEKERTSGTPFYQILEEDMNVEYCCLGIQKPSNNVELFQYAEKKNIHFLYAEEVNMRNWENIEIKLTDFVAKIDVLYLTIDLDGFSSAFAPGVSAPSPMGFSPDIILKICLWLKSTNKLVSADIVELNPEYDLDHMTARLAARLIENIIS